MAGDPVPEAGVVVLIDDHRLLAVPLAAVVEPLLAARGFTMLAPVARVEDVPAVTGTAVAVCDLVLAGGRSGAEAVRELVSRGWVALLMSGRAPQEQILEAIAAGGRGYIEKSVEPPDLVRAIEEVASTGAHLSAVFAALLYADLHRRPLPGPAELTYGERQILKAFVQGQNRESVRAANGLDTAGMHRAIGRILSAGAARRTVGRLTPREIDVIVATGCRELPTAAVARALNISANTVNTHLLSVRVKYLLAHPEADQDISQRAAARKWAEDLNLCVDRAT